MFRIGEFSRFTRVTIKMLRHYDDLGLLAPRFVDPHSGYRYYLAEQLPRLNRILALRELGFSLETVARIVDPALDAAERAALFAQREQELRGELAQRSARLRQLEAFGAGDATEACTAYDVVLRAVPVCRMATIRCRVTSLGAPVTALFERLETQVARQKARAEASPLLIFHDDEYRETDPEVEAAVPVTREIAAVEDIAVRDVEGCPTMACLVYRGNYDQTGGALQALMAWISRQGLRIAGPLREVYLRYGADQAGYRLSTAFLTDKSSEFVTEIQVPAL